jgi:hypothetical protein
VITVDKLDEFKQLITAWENANWRKIIIRKKAAQ